MADIETNKRLLQSLLRGWGVDLTPQRLQPCSVYSLTKKARPGDHIAVRSVVKDKQDVIWHHGVYVGDDHVVHMHPDGNISKVPIDDFMAGLLTVDTYVESAGVIPYEPDTDEARACTMVAALHAARDPEMQRIVYDLVEHQCDGFVAWCRTGRCAALRAVLADDVLHRPPLPYKPCVKFS